MKRLLTIFRRLNDKLAKFFTPVVTGNGAEYESPVYGVTPTECPTCDNVHLYARRSDKCYCCGRNID
jgi:hypothetical protein